MRTLIFTAVGLLVAAAVTWLAPLQWRVRAAAVFTLAWLLVVAWNLRTGLSHGYSLQEELPIQAAIFLIPVALAGVIAWRS